jgi:magnesium chelatase family protein
LLAKVESVALVGTEARPVQVEVFVGQGVPAFRIVGLPSASVREAEQRVRSALTESSERWPPQKIVANLAPGALRKEGTHFDLSLAMGVVAADARLPVDALEGVVALGELALDGRVRPVRGALAAAIACRELGGRTLICPRGNVAEAGAVSGVRVIPVATLKEALSFLRGTWLPGPFETKPISDEFPVHEDLSDVRGHENPKTALEVAAAGGHNLLLLGPPGGGKTMLARRLPGILPPMTEEEALEVTRIYSVAGLLSDGNGLLRQRPFRAPHHNVSLAGLVGGGSGLARPGEISLAHRGVLFLDELGLYRRELLDTLRAPIEDGVIRIARSGGVITFPCCFSLIAAMNPCPCGFKDDAKRKCECSEKAISRYRRKLAGPILDRFDMQVVVDRLTKSEIESTGGEKSNEVRERVFAARLTQAERYGPDITNASVPATVGEVAEKVGKDSILTEQVEKGVLTGRGFVRAWKVARTLADLQGSSEVTDDHIGHALLMKFDGFNVEEAA